MERRERNRITAAAAIISLLALNLLAGPVGTTFTYQGRLKDGRTPANGLYDLKFSLYDAITNGTQFGPTLTNSAVAVSNGIFTVGLDFGAGIFNGDERWLEIGVRIGSDDFTVLSPRQPLTPVPYAILSETLGGPLVGSFTGSFIGDGSGLTNLNPSALTRKSLTTPVPSDGTNYIVDFSSDVVQVIATDNINLLQSTNRTAAGRYGECLWYIQGGATNQTLRVNANWVPVGTLATNTPYLIVSNKLTMVALSVRGPSETNVSYAIARQE